MKPKFYAQRNFPTPLDILQRNGAKGLTYSLKGWVARFSEQILHVHTPLILDILCNVMNIPYLWNRKLRMPTYCNEAVCL